MYRYLLFDLDGTLTDPGLGITNSVMYALRKFDINVEDRTSLYKFIGPPLRDSFEKYYGFSSEESEQAVQYYREYFSKQGLYENEVYDGITDLLMQLKKMGKSLIVATSKPESFAIEILKHFDLYDYFDFVAGATMDDTRNKKADIIQYALESCHITEKSSVIMIGDREHDIIGAKENGLDSIGVLFGYGSYDELKKAGATFIVEKPMDILEVNMKEVILFYLKDCPYCHYAKRALKELRKEKPEYDEISIKWIEEREHPEVADRYNYYYVPTIFYGDKKLYEAHPSENYDDCKRNVKAALDLVCESNKVDR